MKKVYLAGKINGDTNYWHKFDKASDLLQDKGYLVMSPAVLPEGFEPQDYMSICLKMLDCCDILCLLPDWTESAGAKLEYDYSKYTRKLIYALSSLT